MELTVKNSLEIEQSRINGIAELLKESLAKNSRTAYEKDWQLFEAYCNKFNLPSLPATPIAVADFLSNVRTLKGERYKPSSLRRFLVTIKRKHKRANLEDPANNDMIRELLKGIRKSDTRGKRQSKALPFSKLLARVTSLPKTNKGLRDKTLLLIGFGGAFRRGEIASLLVSDIQDTEYGIAITLRKSKTDQTGKGIVKSFVYGKLPEQCPVRTLKQYIEHFELKPEDPLFMRVRKDDLIIRKPLSADGVKGVVERYFPDCTPHSLRAGFVTAAHKNGHTIAEIMQQTGHKSYAQVEEYIRLEQNIKNNAIVGMF